MNYSFSMNLNNPKASVVISLEQTQIYDLLVIGGGPAGLNAALYAKRKGLNTGVIAQTLGGQVKETSVVENYLGTESESGEALVHKFIQHLKALEVPLLEERQVLGYAYDKGVHMIQTDLGERFQAKTILVATGSTPRKLEVPGESDFLGKGVAYCAICDGPLFKGKHVVVAGGGNSAVEAALDLAKIADSVLLVHRSQLRADQILVDQLMKKSNIKVKVDTPIASILGEASVSSIQTSLGEFIPTDGIFIEVGYVPNVGVFKDYLEVNSRGEIVINEKNKTTADGIFAAGDVTDTPYKQIVIAAAEGAKAALAINEYLQQK